MRNKTVSPLPGSLLKVGLLIAAVSLLGGCADLRQAMGMQKVSPDEFAIVTKAPLVLPPDYSLRPPTPGAPRAVVDQPQDLARNALFGSSATPVADGIVTAGEFAILTSARADNANPNIRAILTADGSAVTQKDRRFANRILFWQNASSGYDATMVDAVAEAERIRENEATGRPVGTGETPTITKNRGIF